MLWDTASVSWAGWAVDAVVRTASARTALTGGLLSWITQGHSWSGALPQPGAHVLQVSVPYQRCQQCSARAMCAAVPVCRSPCLEPAAECQHTTPVVCCCCRGAAAAIIVYDITSTDSFNRAKAWVRELQRQGSPNMIMALAGGSLSRRRAVGRCGFQACGRRAAAAAVPAAAGTSLRST